MNLSLPCQQKQKQNFCSLEPKMHRYSMRSKRLWSNSIAIFMLLLINGITKTNAVPTDSIGVRQHASRPLLLQRALRDVATMMTASLMQEEPKDIASSTETMLDQPQGQCLLDGVLVAETTVVCEKQAGCRAIQKTGHCCPDYKCDCEKDGITYLNGDKLVDPETPCTVCYCKAGEILCSSAVCFHRDDCTPRYIPGRCCPEYDNCPIANKTVVSSTQAPKPEQPPSPVAVLNSNITIKEITKPTEIRITDENKAKPIHQMLKTTTKSTTTTTTTTTTTAAPFTTMGSVNNIVPGASSTPKTLTLIKVSDITSFKKDTDTNTKLEDLEEPLIPIEHQNTRAESPISQELQRVDHEYGNDSSKVNIKREYMFATTEGALGGNSSEVVGDFTSTELLYGNSEVEPSDFNGSLLQTAPDFDPETAGSDNIYHIILSTDGPGEIFGSSTEGFTVPKLASSIEGINPQEAAYIVSLPSSTEGVVSPADISSAESDITTDSPKGIISTESTIDSSTLEPHKLPPQHHLEEEDTALPMESNPAYPSLPEDDFSIRLPVSEVDDTAEADLKDESRSIGTAYSHHGLPSKDMEESSTVESGSGGSADVVDALRDTFNDNDANSMTTADPLPDKIQLMYSSEEASSAETAISNSTDFKIDKLMRDVMENETGSGDSAEITSLDFMLGGSEMGSGGGNIVSGEDISATSYKEKEREPTTPKPTQRPTQEIDIDELGNASGDGSSSLLDDPKLDAESVKADEKETDGVAQTDPAAPKNDIVSVNVNPTQDKTLYELLQKMELSLGA